jgi:4a-hydroxytetrahydrobiopterin dehydratase
MSAKGDNLIPEELKICVAALGDWKFTHGDSRIRRDWELKDFKSAIAWINAVAEVAEAEQHHPDVHLEGYRRVWIEIFTHSTGGITERDIRLAAKIDEIWRSRTSA